MKRIVIRLVALGSIVALGWFTIAHVQRWRDRAQNDGAKTAAAPKRAAAKPIPIADDGESPPPANGGLPGTSHPIESSGLISRMQTKAVHGQVEEEGSPASQDPFRRGEPASRLDRNVQQAAAQEPAEAEHDRYGRTAVPGGREQEQPEEFADSQRRAAGGASALLPRQGALAEDQGGSQAQEPEQDNFAPPAGPLPVAGDPGRTGADDPGGDAFAPPANRGSAAVQGAGRPGGAHLEGRQSPTLSIEKIAPAEIQVGKPATFTIKVRNTGSVPAQGVEVYDEIPSGTQLVSTTPRANRGPAGQLIFDLGAIQPKEEVQAQVVLLPVAEGEIGSVATVHFRADASVRTVATKPQLVLNVSGPAKVMIGDQVNLKIKISNPGSGAATGIVLTETVPPALKHSSGNELEFDVGTLKPGESRELDLALAATQPGLASNVLVAHGDANLQAESQADVEVLAPGLKVALNGPKRRYLERNATYNLQVSNPGTAAAKDIQLVAVLPKGLKFVEANNSGQYDAATRSVYWQLEELPPRESGSVALTLLPIEQGELKLQVKGKGQQGLADDHEEAITVEGLAAIVFELSDVNDPIEVGGETTYEVRVINQGTKAATNLRVVALLPPEMKPLSADGPARHVIDSQRVLFDPLPQLAPKADTTYTIKAQGLKAGDLRIRVQIVSDELSTPITKEESTRVYADE